MKSCEGKIKILFLILLFSCTNARDEFIQKFPAYRDTYQSCIEKGSLDKCFELGAFAQTQKLESFAKSFYHLACQNQHAKSCTELGLLSNNEVQRTNTCMKVATLAIGKLV